MKIPVVVQLPSYPNFVCIGESSVDIATLTDEQLVELGKEWAAGLVPHVKSRRERQKQLDRLEKAR